MRCPSCKSVSGELVTMVPSETVRNLWVCPSVWHHAPVLLVDVGLMLEAPPLPKQPSPFREVERRAPAAEPLPMHRPRPCEWAACGIEFTPLTPAQKFHSVVCREAADKASRTRVRAPKACALAACGVEFIPVHHYQLYHTTDCQITADRARKREAWATKQAVAAMLSLAGVGAPAGAGT